MFSPQIHIVFNTNEEDRITKPILDNPPHKLYYFTADIQKTNQKDENLKYFQKNTTLLKERLPHLEIIQKEVDYINYIEVLQKLSKIVKKERKLNPNCKIYINIGSGSKITAIASIEASKLWTLEYYYAYAKKYDPSGKGARHKGEIFIDKPITFPIQKPDLLHIRILKLIKELIEERQASKDIEIENPYIPYKTLIRELFERKYLILSKKNQDYEKIKSAQYVMAQHHLERLQYHLKFINISNERKNKKVYLTLEGEEVVKIFKYLE